ncbi:MAG: hypothetical protein WC528_02930 [Patescibacteria group bacterium]
MRELSVILVALIMFGVTIRYCYLINTRAKHPVPATWIIISLTMILGFITYMRSPVHSWTGNVGNATGVLNTSVICFFVLWTRYRDGELKLAFSRFQKGTLVAAAGIILFWMMFRQASWSNVLTQLLVVIGYIATLQHLWTSPKNTEPFSVWIGTGIAMLIALYPALIDGDSLAVLYATRATVTTLLVVAFMLRIEYRQRMMVFA